MPSPIASETSESYVQSPHRSPGARRLKKTVLLRFVCKDASDCRSLPAGRSERLVFAAFAGIGFQGLRTVLGGGR